MQERRANERVAVADMPALVVDQWQLRCFDAQVRDFSRTGCSIVSHRVAEFPEEFGLQIDEIEDLIIARVLWRSDNCAGVVFDWDEPALPESRREERLEVALPATISNLDAAKLIPCTILEASKTGCRIETEFLTKLNDHVLINIEGMKMSLRGRIAWREGTTAGVSLMWKTARKAPEMLPAAVAPQPPSG